MTHSEGQGYALLLAEAFDDRPTFERVLGWTVRHLDRAEDALHAWRWGPARGAVEDRNNATDADLTIAWALARAASRWGRAEYRARAAAIGRDVLARCTTEANGALLLRPGVFGFEQPDRVVVNLSYYLFAAFRALAEVAPDPRWGRLASDGLALLGQARYGDWGLPPDWLSVPKAGGRPSPWAERPARFAYDAVRVPLNLAWAGLHEAPALAAAAAFWTDARHRMLPAWTDLRTGGTSPYPAGTGINAVAQLSVAAHRRRGRPVSLPSVAAAHDYYGAALTLLVHLAWSEGGVGEVLQARLG